MCWGGPLAGGRWRLFAIVKADGTQDYLAHNAVDPTVELPSGYVKFRRVASIIRATAIRLFRQAGDHFQHETPIDEGVSSAFSTTQTNYALTVPSGIELVAEINIMGFISASYLALNWGKPGSALTTPTHTTGAPTNALCVISTASGGFAQANAKIETNASAAIAIKGSGTSSGHEIFTLGWFDRRGRDE